MHTPRDLYNRWTAADSIHMMPRRAIVLTVLLALVLSAAGHAQQNPFMGGAPQAAPDPQAVPDPQAAPDPLSPQTAPPAEPRGTVEAHSIFRGQPLFPRMNALLRRHQRELNTRFAALLHQHTAAPESTSSGKLIPIITLVAFLYGLIHAALPGHRKVLLVSYFVSTPATVRTAILAGSSVALLHSGGAAVVILTAYYLLRTSLAAAMDSATLYLQGATAAFVLALGVVVVALKTREAVQLYRHTDHPGHAHEEGGSILRILRGRMGLLPAIILSAIVPCPGSAMILLFSLSLGAVSLGLCAVAVFSLGMAITLSTVLAVTVLSKKVLFRALEGRFGEALHVGIEGLGGLVMVLFGAVLLMPYL